MRKNNFLDKFKKVIWILTPFILLAIIIILLMKHCEAEKECFDCDELQEKIDIIKDDIKGIDCLDCDWVNIDGEEVQKPTENDTIIDGEEVYKPTANCRAHFSGLLMTDYTKKGHATEIWKVDYGSEYVGKGEYPRAISAFPKAHGQTFDGIAIDKGTRVIIYSQKNFKGEILLDETGPAIITNVLRIDQDLVKEEVKENNRRNFKEPLNSQFPPSCRKMSSSNMFDWSQGSLKVICNE